MENSGKYILTCEFSGNPGKVLYYCVDEELGYGFWSCNLSSDVSIFDSISEIKRILAGPCFTKNIQKTLKLPTNLPRLIYTAITYGNESKSVPSGTLTLKVMAIALNSIPAENISLEITGKE